MSRHCLFICQQSHLVSESLRLVSFMSVSAFLQFVAFLCDFFFRLTSLFAHARIASFWSVGSSSAQPISATSSFCRIQHATLKPSEDAWSYWRNQDHQMRTRCSARSITWRMTLPAPNIFATILWTEGITCPHSSKIWLYAIAKEGLKFGEGE